MVPKILLQDLIFRACLAEVIAPKPGNVSPSHAFTDTTWQDFATSAELIAPILAESTQQNIGHSIYNSVKAVRDQLHKNTNLGIILLLAPLVVIPASSTIESTIDSLLDEIDLEQTAHVFDAINLANPGGLGKTAEQDVHSKPTLPLRKVMQLAAQHDQIARQYTIGFKDIIRWASSLLSTDFTPENWSNSIIELQLRILIEFPDTLIARKCGLQTAQEASLWALKINFLGGTFTPEGRAEIQNFHQWLIADGNKRNPGTTADLIAATLFVAQRDYHLKLLTTDSLLNETAQQKLTN